VKFTEIGEVDIRVRVEKSVGRSEGDQVDGDDDDVVVPVHHLQFLVKDTGIGQ
jgi:hypothetical protein